MRSTARQLLRLLPAVAIAAVAAGCAGTTAPSPTAFSPSPTTSSPSPTASEGPAAPAGKKIGACRTQDMSAVVAMQPSEGGSTSTAMVQLTNDGGSVCEVDGWASFSLVNALGEVVEVKTEKVEQPGAPTPTTLKAGSSAWAGIKWESCDKGSSDCPAGNSLQFSLEADTDGKPAELEGFPAPEKSNITMGSLRIGSLQPIRQGVVAW
ncbi:DUF4232 domain-containing protein [Winogradskya humida]|uniref:DUF4232 domain-containing protein n=1 Tax=Winogradskya humida TaxID=113566 RepID=A0ABQ3ZGL5_9ACTN|nr:DUF4232 domain-containing protein [Actinoplanes humidus]GIE17648.1 hypothetical protein Ahu01nite_007500 [Actinoplanes humidus]